MPRYFFDTHDKDGLILDRDGLLLDGAETARAEAVKALSEMAGELSPTAETRTVFVVIRDERGEALFRASLTLECEWMDQLAH